MSGLRSNHPDRHKRCLGSVCMARAAMLFLLTGCDAGWELDLFGGARRSVEAAPAEPEAEIEDLNAILVSLLAEVAVNYIDLRTYQAYLAMTACLVVQVPFPSLNRPIRSSRSVLYP